MTLAWVDLGRIPPARRLGRFHNQDGTGNVADPSVIGASGFDAYKFLFSGSGKGIIYAAEVGPTHYYEIPGTFQITISLPA